MDHDPPGHRARWLCTCFGGAPGAGLDLAGFDPAVRFQDDLFRAVNGGWLARTVIPPDRSRHGAFSRLADLCDERVRAIVDGLAGGGHAPASAAARVADFYAAHLDTDRIDRAGLAPMQPRLAEIDAIGDVAALARWMGRQQGRLDTPVRLWVMPDFKSPREHGAITWQGGLGLPDRDYYLREDDARMAAARTAYRGYLGKLARLSGVADPARAAETVFDLEHRIALTHWSRVETRDPVRLYNPTTVAALAAAAPGLDWTGFLQAAGLGGVERLVVSQPSVANGVAQLLGERPLADWKLYLRLRVLDQAADLLPQAFREARFAFRGAALTGATAERPRWQLAIADLNRALGEDVGQLYVARHFLPEHKARMQVLVGHLLEAYRESIDALTWLGAATRERAQQKLARYTTKIGYPDRWRDSSRLEIRADDALGNADRAAAFEWRRIAARACQPVDRGEWGMTPQTVNACYDPSLNEIVFPAAILQPPFFDMAADDAFNYGAIGAVIGHEISHGFDDQGSRFDGDGALADWWDDADRRAFEAVGAELVAQYDAYEPLPGRRVDGRLTLGENMADLSGLQIAYKAYQRSLAGQSADVIDGFSGAQRFFLGWSQVWRDVMREDRLVQMLATDPHAPPEFRANGAAVNHDAFHEAFATRPGDGMFKAPGERIRLW